MVSQIISSLAILKVNSDTLRKDYIENFVPFVAQCVLLSKPSVVSISELQGKMVDEFGLSIPQNSLKVILKRAAKASYIRKEENTYVPNYDVLNTLNFESTRQRVLREHSALMEKLIRFASDKFHIQLPGGKAEGVLLSYITQHDIELLSSSVSGTPIPKIRTLPKKEHYLISAFVRHLYDNDPEGFNYLDTIVKGHMLANTLIFPDLTHVGRRFNRTSVYFDTALMLRVLGYEGEASQAPCKELVGLLYPLGASIRCFSHTRQEIYNVLYACMHMLSFTKAEVPTGRTFRHLSDIGYKQSDVELELAKLDKKIEALGIKIVDKPEYSESFQIDEIALEEALEEEVKYGPERIKAREHDVQCLSAIYRLRKGRDYSEIEDCGALFVTCNNSLSRSSWKFFRKQGYTSEEAAPIAMTDYAFTTILWLKKPMAAPNLPQKYIIADSYAAMEPSDHLWREYLAEIETLNERKDISTDDYYLLRTSPRARAKLMELTMGDEGAFVEGTSQEILERVKQSIRAEVSVTFEEKLEQERGLHEEERKLREQAQNKLQLERVRSREREENLILKIKGLSRRLARWLSKVPFAVCIGLLVFGAYASFPADLPALPGHWLIYFLPIGFVFLMAAGILNLIFGIRLKDYMSRFEVFLASRLEEKLQSWFLS